MQAVGRWRHLWQAIWLVAVLTVTGAAAQAPATGSPPAAPSTSTADKSATAPRAAAGDTTATGSVDKTAATALLGGFFVLFMIVIAGVAVLQRQYQRAIDKVLDSPPGAFGDDPNVTKQAKLEALGILQVSPLGIPEGSVRAILSFVLITGGLMIMMFRKYLQLEGAAEIASILGTVLGFYFGTRNTSDPATAQISKKAEEIRLDVAKANAKIESTQEAIRTTAAPAAAVAEQERVTGSQRELAGVRDKLRVAQQMVRVLGGTKEGATIIDNAAKVIDQGDKLLAVIEPLLSGKPDLNEISNATQQAADALGELRKFGLPGIFGDAIATAQAVTGSLGGGLSAAAGLAGIVGGPAAIVGGLVMSGLKLYSNKQAFDRYEAILLQRPFDRNLLPDTISGNEALLVLEYAPLMSARLRAKGAVGADLAGDVLRAALKSDGPAPRAAQDVARELLSGGPPDLKGYFASQAELAEAIEEYRASAVFKRALQDLPATIELDVELPGASGRSLDLQALLRLVPELRRDRRMASEIDRIYSIVNELADQNIVPATDLATLVLNALTEAQQIAGQDRQLREPPTEKTQ